MKATQFTWNTKRLNKIEKMKNIMWACQGVNLLLFMIKVWTDLNTALFSSSFKLTAPKISRFSEIVSGMSKSEKKSCYLRVVWRGHSNKKWDTVSVIPQIQFCDTARFIMRGVHLMHYNSYVVSHVISDLTYIQHNKGLQR